MRKLRIGIPPKATRMPEYMKCLDINIPHINYPKYLLHRIAEYHKVHRERPAAIVMGWQTSEVFHYQNLTERVDLAVPLFTNPTLDIGFSLLHPPDRAIVRMVEDDYPFEDLK